MCLYASMYIWLVCILDIVVCLMVLTLFSQSVTKKKRKCDILSVCSRVIGWNLSVFHAIYKFIWMNQHDFQSKAPGYESQKHKTIRHRVKLIMLWVKYSRGQIKGKPWNMSRVWKLLYSMAFTVTTSHVDSALPKMKTKDFTGGNGVPSL